MKEYVKVPQTYFKELLMKLGYSLTNRECYYCKKKLTEQNIGGIYPHHNLENIKMISNLGDCKAKADIEFHGGIAS